MKLLYIGGYDNFLRLEQFKYMQSLNYEVKIASTKRDDLLIKKGEDDSKIWESRLLNQFRLDNQNGKWNHEIELLYDQKLNPFELNLQEESEFLNKMRSSHNL